MSGRSRGRFNQTGVGRAAARAQALAQGVRPGARRVVVKARVVKIGQAAAPAIHLRYLQREGTTREGGRGRLYGASDDRADGQAFLERGEGDPHQFRFIVAPEDGAELEDLRGFTRDLMVQVERDLGVPLDWVAVDHFNTGHPHSHVVLRGRDGDGKPLFIAGDYIAHGIRGRASELVTLELGPEMAVERHRRLEAEVDQHRFTSLDRAILRDVAAGDDPSIGRSQMDQSLRSRRLATLERMGLASRESGAWSLRPDLEAILRQLGERGDIIKSLHATLAGREGLSLETLQLHERAPSRQVTGRLVGRRLADDLGDHLAVVIEGFDGRAHHLVIAEGAEEVEAVPLGAIVAVGPRGPRPADRLVAERAAANGGLYRPSDHLADRQRSGEGDASAFVDAHVRRLEALRRRGLVERLDADSWSIPKDFLERASALEAQQSRRSAMRVLSLLDLDAQVTAEGATWLDRQLVARTDFSPDTPLGREVGEALAARVDRLAGWGEASVGPDGQPIFRPGMLGRLGTRELRGAGERLSGEVGLPFGEVSPGEDVSGIYRRRVQLTSGAFALVERSHDFVLVPWRPVIEPQLGGAVRGVALGGGGIDWRLGRDRGPAL